METDRRKYFLGSLFLVICLIAFIAFPVIASDSDSSNNQMLYDSYNDRIASNPILSLTSFSV